MPTLLEHAGRRFLQYMRYESDHVSTSVGHVHVLRRPSEGTLPPLLLLHGFGAGGLHWGPILRLVRPKVRGLVVPDMPGHGFSDVPAGGLTHDTLRAGLIEALDSVVTEPHIVIGNSLGGVAAIRYANARPLLTSGLLLLSPAGAPLTDDELQVLLDRFRMESHGDAVAFLDQLFARPSPFKHFIAPALRRRFQDPVLREWIETVDGTNHLAPDELSALRMPVQLIWGQQERILPPTSLAFFRAHLPEHAEVVEPEHFGHSPFLDDPADLAARIVAFASRLDGA